MADIWPSQGSDSRLGLCMGPTLGLPLDGGDDGARPASGHTASSDSVSFLFPDTRLDGWVACHGLADLSEVEEMQTPHSVFWRFCDVLTWRHRAAGQAVNDRITPILETHGPSGVPSASQLGAELRWRLCLSQPRSLMKEKALGLLTCSKTASQVGRRA